jgi:hypothetical protein
MAYERDELDLAYFETNLIAARLRYGGDNNSKIYFQVKIKDYNWYSPNPNKNKFETDSTGFSQAISCMASYISGFTDKLIQWSDEQPAPEL